MARDGVKLAERHGRIGMRAYMHVFLLEDSKKRLPNDNRPWIPVGVINAGQTPAINARVLAKICAGPFPLTTPLPAITDTGQGSRASMYAGQKDIVLTARSEKPLDRADLIWLEPLPGPMELLSSSHRLYLYGEISYVDVFDKRWRATFRLCTDGIMIQNGRLTWCADGNGETELKQ